MNYRICQVAEKDQAGRNDAERSKDEEGGGKEFFSRPRYVTALINNYVSFSFTRNCNFSSLCHVRSELVIPM